MPKFFHSPVLAWSMLLLFVAIQTGCKSDGGGSKAPKYDSPAKVFEAAKSAVEKKDMAGFLKCMTPESQEVFAGVLAMSALMMKALAEAFGGGGDNKELAKIDDVLKKHGLTTKMMKELENSDDKDPKAAIKKLTAPIKDKPAFVKDIMAALESMGDKGGGGGPADDFAGKLTNVKVDGDSATGTVTQTKDGEKKEDEINFKKVNGGWLIDLSSMLDKVAG